MCTLIQLEMVAEIAKDMFPGTIVNIAPLYKHDMNLKCLLNGRQEWNPIDNRRHAWDIMIHYNLYVKKLDDGFWECGEHGDVEDTVIDKSPLTALVYYAFRCISN